MSIQPAGEGTIKRAAKLLQMKLQKEGLFDESRKRRLPYPPNIIGLVASRQSAAYADFIKILSARWQGVEIQLIDVQVQGEVAPGQIVSALEQFNAEAETPDVIVVIRGGGSPEDLAAFSTEQVTRAVAASRVPTLVAIGHEIDLSLAELAADQRASTPSNAAELLVPDRLHLLSALPSVRDQLNKVIDSRLKDSHVDLESARDSIDNVLQDRLDFEKSEVTRKSQLLTALSPEAILRRGYAIVRHNKKPVRSAQGIGAGGIVEVELALDVFEAKITKLTDRKGK
jgi:exodeoxyribonuclease VII large subunit